MEFILAIVIIIATLIYFLYSRSGSSESTIKPGKKNKANNTSTDKTLENTGKINQTRQNTSTIVKPEQNEKSLDKSLIVDKKSSQLNSFREGKEMRNPYVSKNGKIILFHDEKKISLCFLNDLEEKNPKFISKTVEQDVISDASFSEDKK
jgi:hypothetical protein